MFKIKLIVMLIVNMLSVIVLLTPKYSFAAPPMPVAVDTEVEIQQRCFLILNPDGSVEVYDNDEIYSFIEQNVLPDPEQTYSDLSSYTSNTNCLTVVFIVDNQLALKNSDLDALRAIYNQGNIVGTLGSPVILKDALGINDSLIQDDNDVANTLHFMYTDGDKVNEISNLEHVTLFDTFDSIISWYDETENDKVLQKNITPSGAWDADYTTQWKNSFEGGSYRVLVNAFYLKTNNAKYDWALFTVSMQTSISDYSSNLAHCGWYSTKMRLKAAVNTSNGGELYEYMPTGTVGSVTTGFSIGGSLTGQIAKDPGIGVGISASYSQSYTISDATYVDKSSYVTNTAEWQIDFNGPGYEWYPWYRQPPIIARNSYQTTPSFIVQVPKGQCAVINLNPYIEQAYDDLIFRVFVLSVKRKYQGWYDYQMKTPIRLNVCK